MLRWIIGSSLQLRLLVVVIAATIITIGVAQLGKAPVDILPEFSPPYVEIQTESLGLSAEEVEQLITVPMEQDLLNGLPWLNTIRSESVPGLSSIVLIFEPGTDLMRARQMVSERLTQAVALPHVSKPPIMLQPLSATSRVIIVGLSSKSLSHIQMSVLARWTIAPRLMGVPGVANVAIWGQRDRQLQVQVDPKRLRDKKVSLLKVLETTGNALWVSSLSFVEASTPGTGGFIDTSNQRLGIRHILPIVSPEGLSQVPIEGTDLHLGDVANVVEDHQPLIGDALTNDGPGLLLVVEKFPGANTLAVTRGVEDALEELRPGLPGMDVDQSVYRPADFIETAIHNLSVAALMGLIFMALILAAFFFEWRTALISLLAIPLSLVAAGLVLYVTGATINMIVVTGFVTAIGVVVYDAITDVENIVRRLRQCRKDQNTKSTARIILEASHEARSAIIYAALIVLLTVSPVFFIGGLSGAFFRPLAVSYGLAVIASLVVALTVTPALCLLFLTNASIERRESPLVRWLQRAYEPMLARVIQRGRLAFATVGVLTIVGLAILPFLSRSLLPSFKELSLLIHLKTVPGTSQPEMSRISGRVSRELKSISGVRSVGTHIGRAVLGDQVVNVNSAELWVNIDAGADYDKTATAIQEVVEGYPGIAYDVETYLREKSGDVVAEPEDNIVVRVYGDTYRVLGSKAEDVKNAISGIEGIVEAKVKLPVQQATLETEVDLSAAQHHGLKPGDVRRAVATLLSGIQVGSLFEDQKVFDVVVWSTPQTRQSISSIRDLTIDTPGGGHVRLGDVAQVRIVPSASVIRHDAVKRYVDVVADVQGRELSALAADISGRIQQIEFPLEYHAEVLGEYAVPQAARTRLVVLTLGAALGVFFLLQAAFGSWRLAALSFVTLPAAMVGGLLAALATGGSVVSLGSLAGLLAVFGITVCGSITLLKHYQHLTGVPENGQADPEFAQFRTRFDVLSRLDPAEPTSGANFGPRLVQRGACDRLAPILITMLTTGLALVPALLVGDVPGLEIVRPMAIVTLGGLVTSTLFTLFGVPAMFLLFGHRRGSDLDDLTLTFSDEEMREAMSRARTTSKDVQSKSLSN
jgi:CzcA family heavy metal efflux pump